MATPIKSKGFRFGVRGSLFAAFAVIAGMAVVISAGAGLMLGRLGGTMVDLSGRDIPRLAASLQLSAQSASLASQGPALLAARSEEALNDRTRKMKETQAVALQKLGEIVELGFERGHERLVALRRHRLIEQIARDARAVHGRVAKAPGAADVIHVCVREHDPLHRLLELGDGGRERLPLRAHHEGVDDREAVVVGDHPGIAHTGLAAGLEPGPDAIAQRAQLWRGGFGHESRLPVRF